MKNNKIYAINYNTYSDIEEVGLFITKKDAEIELNRINKTREHNLKSKKFFGLQEDDGMLALSLEEGYYSIEEKLFGLNKNDFIKNEDYLMILDLLLNEASIEKNLDYLVKLNLLVHRTSSLNINEILLKTLIQKVIILI